MPLIQGEAHGLMDDTADRPSLDHVVEGAGVMVDVPAETLPLNDLLGDLAPADGVVVIHGFSGFTFL
jgi:hypothetical protein